MAKAPRAGCSKTRLCPPLTPQDAAALSAAFLHDTTQSMAEAAARAPIARFAAYAPAGTENLVRAHIASGTVLVLADGSPPMPDGVDGFGRCLLHAIDGMLAEGHAAACVLSSDCPTLPTTHLVEAARLLLEPGDRAVLGACADGGYYLLGLKARCPEMFSRIAWSTASVAETTRARARGLDLDLVELPPWYDVDDAATLACLQVERGGYAAHASRAVLARLGYGEGSRGEASAALGMTDRPGHAAMMPSPQSPGRTP
ncbi:glycosyltransferase A (GT-A) superfamily protein (DUF2064 family) [Methylobacterium sp. BE186]|uniref:TIGR04282 family arsenosugar biosynthesis glycosyltransferase n=1 Tax=Methylobacterium sp. BE186 TaxID=2817715 RepID=UPI00285DCF67|nr:DUF2064 domain-containing protein [Methylobacterium sp. BE186]MDR7040450.1 glycosyltransferase A (GT-A) superfamily protein (DUF2064 family) [Methylobacterium sp. BE186]